jgi:hypothetical protein
MGPCWLSIGLSPETAFIPSKARGAWLSPIPNQITNMSRIYWTVYHKEQILTQYFGISAFVIRYLIHSEDWVLLDFKS